MRVPVAVLLVGVLAVGCGAPDSEPDDAQGSRPGQTSPEPTSSSTGVATSSPSSPAPGSARTAEALRPVRPADFDRERAMQVVRHLAGTLGPRPATGPAHRAAADYLAERLRRLGLQVRRQRFAVPGGESWGVGVPAGESVNVVATPPDFDAGAPHLVVGAHLDTVPQAPGAEDNASGVGVLLAAAQAAAQRRTRLPVVWVGFGAEEPRGPSDDDHHYGSRAFVRSLEPAQRRGLRAMVSLDRVGVGAVVPVGSAGDGDPVQRSLVSAARRAGVPTLAESGSRSSDHWSFVRDGLPGARLGSTPYAGYHSPADRPSVVQPAQLERTGRLLLAWLARSG